MFVVSNGGALQSLIRSQAAIVEAWLRACGTDGRVLHELADYVIGSVGGEQTDVGEQRLDSLEQARVVDLVQVCHSRVKG